MKTVERSFQILRTNPKLFIPDLFFIAIMYIVAFILYTYVGIGDLITIISDVETISAEVLRAFLSENITELIVSFVVFAVVTFVLGVGVAVLKYHMINQLLKEKKVSLLIAWRERNQYFWSVVLLRFVVFLIWFLMLVLVFLIIALIYLLINPFLANNIALSIAGVSAIPLLILTAVALKLILLFRYPILFVNKIKNPWKIINQSFHFCKKNLLYTVVTGIVILGLDLMMAILASGLGAGITTILSYIPFIFIATTGAVIWSLCNVLLDLAADIWGHIVLFNRFKQK